MLAQRRMNGGLENLPAQQATFLAIRRQPSTIKPKHVFRGELLGLFHSFALQSFEQHRGRGLANDATLATEVAVADAAIGTEFKLDPNDIATERIIIFVGVGGGRQMPTVEGVLVVIEDMFLIEFFFVGCHRGRGVKLYWIKHQCTQAAPVRQRRGRRQQGQTAFHFGPKCKCRKPSGTFREKWIQSWRFRAPLGSRDLP